MRKISLLAVAVLAIAAMTVQSASRPMGTIKVPANLQLELKVDNKPVPVPSGKEISMAAGSYVPAGLTAQVVGAAGKKGAEIWSIKSIGPFGKLQKIDIVEGATSEIDAGPPLTVKTVVYKAQSTPQGKVVPVGLVILGKAGEQYAANTLKKGLSLASPPQVQILDEKGTVLAQGNFEYG
jgi:hypothetical protein